MKAIRIVVQKDIIYIFGLTREELEKISVTCSCTIDEDTYGIIMENRTVIFYGE